MSEGITVTLTLALKAEAVEPFCTNIPLMLDDTRKFPGFRDIRILRSSDKPETVILIEDWDSREDYAAYTAFRTETGVMDDMAQMLTAPPQLAIWDMRIA